MCDGQLLKSQCWMRKYQSIIMKCIYPLSCEKGRTKNRIQPMKFQDFCQQTNKSFWSWLWAHTCLSESWLFGVLQKKYLLLSCSQRWELDFWDFFPKLFLQLKLLNRDIDRAVLRWPWIHTVADLSCFLRGPNNFCTFWSIDAPSIVGLNKQ